MDIAKRGPDRQVPDESMLSELDDQQKNYATVPEHSNSAVGPVTTKKVEANQETAQAEVQQVVWARVKGFPPWPGQVMSAAAATVYLGDAPPRSKHMQPVMFFGTLEVAWILPAALTHWQVGLDKHFHARKDRRLLSSIQEARRFLAGKSIPNWWQQSQQAESPLLDDNNDDKDHEEQAQANNIMGQVASLRDSQPVLTIGTDMLPAARKAKREIHRWGIISPCAPFQDERKEQQRKPPQPDADDSDNEIIGKGYRAGKLKPSKPDTDASAPEPDCRKSESRDDKKPVKIEAVPLLPLSDVAQANYNVPRKRQKTGPSAARISSSAGAKISAALPGSQAAVHHAEGVVPPKYEFSRKNIWPMYLPKPKRQPRDEIPTCNCWPRFQSSETANVSHGRHGTGVGSVMSQASDCMEPHQRSKRARTSHVDISGRANCGPECINRQSYVHCDEKTCPCGIFCTNRPFHKLPIPKLTAIHTGDRGWGIRAEEFIPCGAFVIEYSGELINKAEKQKRLELQARSGILDFYMMEHSPGVIIDARMKGNLARLINSSCDPNCVTQKWHDAATNESRIGIFTKRDIQAGEELAYDYNFEHSGLAEQAGAYRCKCGAAKCRGTMDTQPNRMKDAFKRVEVFWDGEQRYYRGTVISYQASSGLHVVCYDDGQKTKENFQLVEHRWLPDDTPLCTWPVSADGQPEIVTVQPGSELHAEEFRLGHEATTTSDVLKVDLPEGRSAAKFLCKSEMGTMPQVLKSAADSPMPIGKTEDIHRDVKETAPKQAKLDNCQLLSTHGASAVEVSQQPLCSPRESCEEGLHVRKAVKTLPGKESDRSEVCLDTDTAEALPREHLAHPLDICPSATSTGEALALIINSQDELLPNEDIRDTVIHDDLDATKLQEAGAEIAASVPVTSSDPAEGQMDSSDDRCCSHAKPSDPHRAQEPCTVTANGAKMTSAALLIREASKKAEKAEVPFIPWTAVTTLSDQSSGSIQKCLMSDLNVESLGVMQPLQNTATEVMQSCNSDARAL